MTSASFDDAAFMTTVPVTNYAYPNLPKIKPCAWRQVLEQMRESQPFVVQLGKPRKVLKLMPNAQPDEQLRATWQDSC